MQIKCVVCGKITAGRLPRASRHDIGDGTFWFPRRHKVNGGDCPGNIVEGEDVSLLTQRAADGSQTRRISILARGYVVQAFRRR